MPIPCGMKRQHYLTLWPAVVLTFWALQRPGWPDRKGILSRSVRNDPPGLLFLSEPRAQRRRRSGSSFHQPINLPRSACLPKQVLIVYLVNSNVVSFVSIFSRYFVDLVLLLLFQWVTRYTVRHGLTPSWSGTGGGLHVCVDFSASNVG